MRVRWVIDPDDDDTVSKTINVDARDDIKGSRRIDTDSIADARLVVNSTCPKWVVTMMEAPASTPAPTPKPSNCHPSYRGQCLKRNTSDYDCSWGTGNGPEYVYGTVRVVGPDVFDLDRDNDGIGCERG